MKNKLPNVIAIGLIVDLSLDNLTTDILYKASLKRLLANSLFANELSNFAFLILVRNLLSLSVK